MKNSIWLAIAATTILSSCKDDTPKIKSEVLNAQLKADFGQSITNVIWSTRGDFDVAQFTGATKADDDKVEAWYKYNDDNAELEMESRDQGTEIPTIIKAAFEATQYSDATQWKIEEVELEQDYNEKNIGKTYEVELENIADPNIEATLVFDAITGKLLFSTEEMDDNDDDDTKIPVSDEIIAVVNSLYPGAVVVDVEFDDNKYEIDAILEQLDGSYAELEIELDSSFKVLNYEMELEHSYTYATMQPTAAKDSIAAFNDKFEDDNFVSIPDDTKVEIKKEAKKEGTEYEVEFEEFTIGNTEYELSYKLNASYQIIDSEADVDEN